MSHRFIWMLLTAACVTSLHGQSRNATMQGTRGDTGKCTVEVNVDEVAEIEITGSRAELHTLGGSPATWVRFECNDTLPRLPDSFKFSGVDGRGRQTLIKDPRDNRGVAVIRIEDPKGGREGYTFNIEWKGFANSATQPPRYEGVPANGREDDRAINACVDAVKERANRDYRYQNIEIKSVGYQDPSRHETVSGRFSYRRGQSEDMFDFVCTVDTKSNRVRNVSLRRW